MRDADPQRGRFSLEHNVSVDSVVHPERHEVSVSCGYLVAFEHPTDFNMVKENDCRFHGGLGGALRRFPHVRANHHLLLDWHITELKSPTDRQPVHIAPSQVIHHGVDNFARGNQ
jgi:hypothetical protein